LRVARQRARRGGVVPVLIFNGIGASLELLEPFVEALQDVEIVVFDARGTGASRLGYFRIVIVNSLGLPIV
jgi:alpha-beta hydrolase superfamily lysophospholipase